MSSLNKPVIKITLTGSESSIDIYEIEPGKLSFEVYDSDDHNQNTGNGYVDTDAQEFLSKLQRLLSK